MLLASYGFYMWGEPLFVLLLIGSTLLDYGCARAMEMRNTKQEKRVFLYLSLLGNLGALFVFKYLGFFNELLRDLSNLVHLDYPVEPFTMIFPLGISFYTFQSLSYTIDVYRGTRKAEKHFGYLALYVAFFPQLVAGPIERSTTLLPQLREKHSLNWSKINDGLRLITWGLFKKIVLADFLGRNVDIIYATPEQFHGFVHFFAAAAFTLQIYFDFSAYSDIAIGSANIFGIDLSINFNRPFRSTNIRQFWSHWHMTMTNWFFDYLYKPLARKFRKSWQLNVLIFMLIVGFWHGPTWGFILFGLIHGIAYILSDYLPTFEHKQNQLLDKIFKGTAMLGVFLIVVLSAFFFRAETVGEAWFSLREACASFVQFDFSISDLHLLRIDGLIIGINLLFFLIIQNLRHHDPKNPFASIRYRWLRWSMYYYLIFMIVSLAHTRVQDFIYFHF